MFVYDVYNGIAQRILIYEESLVVCLVIIIHPRNLHHEQENEFLRPIPLFMYISFRLSAYL